MLCTDTETTAIDLWHGGLPYSVQFCDGVDNSYIVWDVDPFTRIPSINSADIEWIVCKLLSDRLLFHNCKFDIRAIQKACEHVGYDTNWVKVIWDQVEDTLIKYHALRNLWPHSLKDMREVLLGVGRDNQDRLKIATNQARKICQSKEFIAKYGQWRIATDDDPHWPGIIRTPKEKVEDIEGWWLFDTWLPRTIAQRAPEFLPPENLAKGQLHSWWTVSKDYAIEDVETTLICNEVLDPALVAEGLKGVSDTRHRELRLFYEMEEEGVNVFGFKLHTEKARYAKESTKYAIDVHQTAKDAGLDEFNIDSDKQLRHLLHEVWNLPVLNKTESSKTFPEGQPKVDAQTLEALAELVETSPIANNGHLRETQKNFFAALSSQKRNAKCVEQLDSYWRWSVKHGNRLKLHQSINPTGTRFTRQSSSSPNLQNAATGKEVIPGDKESIDFLTRVVMGPGEDEEWLSLDFQSIEFLIWGISCGNKEVIQCYEQGIPLFKPIMEAVWGFFDKDDKRYKKSKNGIYSRIYGSGEAHSDKTFGKVGAVRSIDDRMPEIKVFTRKLSAILRKQGYITTVSGYRLYVEADEPHKVVSAYVQGHAGYVIGEAMLACDEVIRKHRMQNHVKMILQIHDELIFKGPKGFHKLLANDLMDCMRATGEKYGFPTPVNKTLISTNWGEGEELKDAA